MPLFHFIGNFTNGTGTQPVYLNDVNGIVLYKGVFHQFGQCGRGHAVSLFCGVHHMCGQNSIMPPAFFFVFMSCFSVSRFPSVQSSATDMRGPISPSCSTS